MPHPVNTPCDHSLSASGSATGRTFPEYLTPVPRHDGLLLWSCSSDPTTTLIAHQRNRQEISHEC